MSETSIKIDLLQTSWNFNFRSPPNKYCERFSNSCPWYVFHFINHVQVLMACPPSTTKTANFCWAKNLSGDLYCNDSTNLLSLATFVNAYPMSALSVVNNVWNISTFHIVPLNQTEVTSETWTSIIPSEGGGGWRRR